MPHKRGVSESPSDSLWDRDVRAFFAALCVERGQRSVLSERRTATSALMAHAIEAADIAENARRARATQTGGKIGRCDVTRMPECGPRYLVRCSLLGGHDDPHRFEDE